jgi:Tfp pilus assembly PilM family ATPase
MSRLIALEWDDFEARVAVAEVRRGSMTLEQAFAVALPAALAPGGTGAMISASGAHDLGAIGRRIGEALLARGVRKTRTLVAVGRANIELKNLTLPPCPPEELPELVRFQAEREFNTLGDDWPLDYIPQPGAEHEPQTVLAAAISPDLVAEIEVTCQSANLTPERLVLRPCAAASLLSRMHPSDERKLRLLVDLLADEADLTVLAGDTVVFLRTARLPHELLESDPIRALLPEIRRTIAAVQNRFQGQYITEIFLCGAGADQESLVREIGRDLNLPAELFNPLTCCALSPELQSSLPKHPSRFAPLAGMLLDETSSGSAVIDFLNPRRRPKAQSEKRKYVLPAIAAATILFAIVAWHWYELHSLEQEIIAATETLKVQESKLPLAEERVATAALIENWLNGDIVWLDELAELSQEAPTNKELIVTKFVGAVPENAAAAAGKAGPKSRGTLKLDGVAQDRGIWVQLEQKLKDLEHHVTSPPPNPSDQKSDVKFSKYPWQFNADVRINTPSSQPAGKALPKGQPAPAKPTAPAKSETPSGAPETSPEKKAEDKAT